MTYSREKLSLMKQRTRSNRQITEAKLMMCDVAISCGNATLFPIARRNQCNNAALLDAMTTNTSKKNPNSASILPPYTTVIWPA
jgi:hypothetical protein